MNQYRIKQSGLALIVLILAVLGSGSLYQHVWAVTGKTVNAGGERVRHSDPAAADFNGDGYQEIVIGGYDGRLSIISTSNGNSWSKVDTVQVADAINSKLTSGTQSTGRIESAIAIGDIDADGKLEIVVSTGGFPDASNPGSNKHGSVIAYEVSNSLQLSLKSGWPTLATDAGGQGSGGSTADGVRDGFWSAPALGDLDGDGDLEIVVLGLDRKIYAWHHNGIELAGWPISRTNGDPILRGGWSSAAIADIDNDGLAEVVVGTDSPPWNGDDLSGPFPPQYNSPDYTKATVWALNGDGSLVDGWPQIVSQWTQSAPAIGDIDGDGDLEIVIGAGQGGGTDGNKVYAWHGNGTAVSGWPKSTAGVVRASPALADMNADGKLDVIVGCGAESDSSCKKIYGWQGSGSNLPGFPINTTYTNAYDPVIADIDNDDKPEIIIASNFSNSLFVYEHNGVLKNDFTRVQQNATAGVLNTPLVADVDNDGLLETVMAAEFNNNAGVYIWDETGAHDLDSLPWPTFQNNAARTGLLQGPSLDVTNQVRIYHDPATGATAVYDLTLNNSGGGQFDWTLSESIGALSLSQTSGTLTDSTVVSLNVDTSALARDTWITLGNIQVTGAVGGEAVSGSPQTVKVLIYIGDVAFINIPLIVR